MDNVTKRQRIPKGQSKMNNPEKLTTQGTKDTRGRKTKQKHNTICIGHYYTQTNKTKVKKKDVSCIK